MKGPGTPETSRDAVTVHGDGVPHRVIHAGRRGRGVVTERNISQGELIERAPDLFIPEAARAAVDPTNVGNYSFNSRAGPPLAEEGPGRRGSRLYEPRRSLARAELQHGRRRGTANQLAQPLPSPNENLLRRSQGPP